MRIMIFVAIILVGSSAQAQPTNLCDSFLRNAMDAQIVLPGRDVPEGPARREGKRDLDRRADRKLEAMALKQFPFQISDAGQIRLPRGTRPGPQGFVEVPVSFTKAQFESLSMSRDNTEEAESRMSGLKYRIHFKRVQPFLSNQTDSDGWREFREVVDYVELAGPLYTNSLYGRLPRPRFWFSRFDAAPKTPIPEPLLATGTCVPLHFALGGDTKFHFDTCAAHEAVFANRKVRIPNARALNLNKFESIDICSASSEGLVQGPCTIAARAISNEQWESLRVPTFEGVNHGEQIVESVTRWKESCSVKRDDQYFKVPDGTQKTLQEIITGALAAEKASRSYRGVFHDSYAIRTAGNGD